MRIFSRVFIVAVLFCAGCKRNPVDRLVDPLPSSARPFPGVNGMYVVYDDELKTGGGLGFIPGGQNQSIDVSATDFNRAGRQIRYTWNGNDVSSTTTPQHLFAGFALLVTPNFSGFESAAGKDFSAAGYTKLKFFVRGDLAIDTVLRIEGPDDGLGGVTPDQINSGTDFTLTSSWQEITMNITPNTFSNVKTFLIVTFQYTQPPRTTFPGGGGTVYFDDIRYEQ